MANVLSFESRNEMIVNDIEHQVFNILAQNDGNLPGKNSGIVNLYLRKIEGTYDVGRANKDMDYATDLLHIAYNTTPDERHDIRNKISTIMGKLIEFQRHCERIMVEVTFLANDILRGFHDTFYEWRDVKDAENIDQEIRNKNIGEFIATDFNALIKNANGRVLRVVSQLQEIANYHGDILVDAARAASMSAIVLGVKLQLKEAIEKEMAEANAKRERVDAYEEELKHEVIKFEKKLKEYESKANSAEKRHFEMAILQLGAQMVSSAMPTIVIAQGPAAMGDNSIIAKAAMRSVSQFFLTTTGEFENRENGERIQISEEQKVQVAVLHEMLTKMLCKVECYEKEKCIQNAELLEFIALLKENGTEDETIQLSIKSLNLSIAALKRPQEIIIEIAFFLKSFADFMLLIGAEAAWQMKNIETVDITDAMRRNAFESIIKTTDEFFIKQVSELNAVNKVADKLSISFADNWSKLNKLAGTNLTENELHAYLQIAADKMTEIVAERDAVSSRKIADLDGYRSRVLAD